MDETPHSCLVKEGGWYCGGTRKAAACDTGIPYGFWFMLQVLHFGSCSLLKACEKQHKAAELSEPLSRLVGDGHVALSSRL